MNIKLIKSTINSKEAEILKDYDIIAMISNVFLMQKEDKHFIAIHRKGELRIYERIKNVATLYFNKCLQLSISNNKECFEFEDMECINCDSCYGGELMCVNENSEFKGRDCSLVPNGCKYFYGRDM